MISKIITLKKGENTIKISSSQSHHIKKLIEDGYKSLDINKDLQSLNDQIVDDEDNDGAGDDGIEEIKPKLTPKKRRGRPKRA